MSAYLHISLALALILIAVNSLTAQQITAASFLQNLDAEIAIPDEDILLIDEILNGQWPPGKELAQQILNLSVIEYDDESILEKVRSRKAFFKIADKKEASIFLKQLVKAIETITVADEKLGRLKINQYLVFNDEYRYRWKLNYNLDKYSFGFIAERDPNESKLLDHTSGYFSKQFSSGKIILGDFQIVSGFGLWSWRSVATRKSFESLAGLPRMGRGISPYHSANEAWFIRGIGYTKYTQFGSWLFSGGYTHQDGNIDGNGNVQISSSGLHTGATSIAQQNNVVESVAVGQWNYIKPNTKVSASLSGVKWNTQDGAEKQDWSGSFAMIKNMKMGNAFGEIARGFNNTGAVISGFRLNLPNAKYLISTRYYTQGYSALRSNPFAEWLGKDRNEKGIFQSISFKQNDHQFIIYGDIFQAIEAENGDSFPQTGQEAGLRWEKRKGRNYHKLQWVWQKKSIENSGNYLLTSAPEYEINNTLKYSSAFQISETMRNKIQLAYSFDETTDLNSNAFGINYAISREGENLAIFLDLVTTFTSGGSAWIYFWDLNLQGEMTTRVYTKDSFSPAIKFMYQTASGFDFGFRTRALWKNFDFRGNPKIFGALVIEAVL